MLMTPTPALPYTHAIMLRGSTAWSARVWRRASFDFLTGLHFSCCPAMLLSFGRSLPFPQTLLSCWREERGEGWKNCGSLGDGDANTFCGYLLHAYFSFLLPGHYTHMHTHTGELSERTAKSILVPDNNNFLWQRDQRTWEQRTESINTSTGSEGARGFGWGTIAGLSQSLVLPLDCHLVWLTFPPGLQLSPLYKAIGRG